MNKFALRFDEYSCWGCKSCETACSLENKIQNGAKCLEIVEDGPKIVDGKPFFTYRARVCRHCDNPPCIGACPVGAITKRDDGIVILKSDDCTGCASCIEACPYDAISMDSDAGVARKCNMCYFRIDHGLYPACADNICLAHCVYFGNAGEIEKMIKEKPWLKKRMEQASSEIARQRKK